MGIQGKKGSKVLVGVNGNLSGGQDVVIFQKNGVVKAYHESVHVKRKNQYRNRVESV